VRRAGRNGRPWQACDLIRKPVVHVPIVRLIGADHYDYADLARMSLIVEQGAGPA
jgi:hypothetical protein